MEKIIKEESEKIGKNLYLFVLTTIIFAIALSIYMVISYLNYESAVIISSNSNSNILVDSINIFSSWAEGNLGKLLTMLGFAGTFLIYTMTHKGAVLLFGIIVSLIAGGLVGISSSFFNAGQASFTVGSLFLSSAMIG